VKCSNCGEDIANKRVSGRKDVRCYTCRQKKAKERYTKRRNAALERAA
jgi:DNA-directed RNA polymerase subunit N (RpoN/RPB10)